VTIRWAVVIAVSATIIAALALLWLIWWLWWRLPKRQVARLSLKIRDPKARADVEDNFRKTIGQALGGAAVLIGAGVAYLQFTQQQRASHDLLISNQVSKGFEQLASNNLTMRLGGIYALEGVMNTSEQYRQSVLEALCAFVREGTKEKVNDRPATDIQAALTVIGRRKEGPGEVDLSGANLSGAHLDGADLSGADLDRAHLSAAHLSGAHLDGANLDGANLDRAHLFGAHLDGADLSGADLDRAHLSGAYLISADLFGADLDRAHLFGAYLISANLFGADLSDADLSDPDLHDDDLRPPDWFHLSGANLSYADLHDANLSDADLSYADLDNQAQLDQACGTDVKPPAGFHPPKPCRPLP
jgi:uncharacterized protein YjbI with pentapeptide repeats